MDGPSGRGDGRAPRGQQSIGPVQPCNILRELALQKFDGIRTAKVNYSVQLDIYLWHTSRMTDETRETPVPEGAAVNPDDESRNDNADPLSGARVREKEIGGRGGPDPTRYGDWEKNGRCIDF